MQAGKLNSRIRIEAYTESRGDMGGVVQAWTLVAEVWADVRFLSGIGYAREYTAHNTELSDSALSIRIRRRKDVSHSMRVLYNGNSYPIVAVLDDPQKREYTDLVCKLDNRDNT